MTEINKSVCKAAFDETVDAIVITDGAMGKIVKANKSCWHLLYCEKQDLMGENLFDFLDQKDTFTTAK